MIPGAFSPSSSSSAPPTTARKQRRSENVCACVRACVSVCEVACQLCVCVCWCLCACMCVCSMFSYEALTHRPSESSPQLLFLAPQTPPPAHTHTPSPARTATCTLSPSPTLLKQKQHFVLTPRTGIVLPLIHDLQQHLFANKDTPLVEIYNICHFFCLSLQLGYLQMQVSVWKCVYACVYVCVWVRICGCVCP